MFGTFRNRERRSPNKRRRFQPRPETLEDRTVANTILTGMDMSTMTATIGGYPHAGPTHLYLNFDWAAAGGVSPAGLSDENVQEILYRTSEIYAPFNVEVSGPFASVSQTVFCSRVTGGLNNLTLRPARRRSSKGAGMLARGCHRLIFLHWYQGFRHRLIDSSGAILAEGHPATSLCRRFVEDDGTGIVFAVTYVFGERREAPP
jgi:hypothetical protein